MGCFCKRSSGMSPKLLQQLRSKLSLLAQCFPGARAAFIVNTNGGILVNTGDDEAASRAAPMLESLRNAALDFGSSVGQKDGPVIHIKGERSLFSCYDLRTHMVAVYSEMHSSTSDLFDAVRADDKVGPIVDDVRIMLSSAAP